MRQVRLSLRLLFPLLLGLAGLCAAAEPVEAPPEEPAKEQAPAREGSELDLPVDEIRFLGKFIQHPNGDLEFTGPVTIIQGASRMQADRMMLSDKRFIEAEGNVLIAWGQNRLFGTRMTYDLEENQGEIENAIGSAMSEFLFWAKRVEIIGENKIRLEQALLTTCTQPVPYWSFRVSSAKMTLDKYARTWNVRLKVGKVPIFYLPYLIWPVKRGRAVGLLMPELENSQRNGRGYSQELFIPIGRSADITLVGRYYTKAGFGGGGMARYIPTRSGQGVVDGFVIDDRVDGRLRYRYDVRHTQNFRNGFRMVADISEVSDAQYYSDYARDLNVVASPDVLARLEFSRSLSWTSLNVRELRRQQLSTGLVQQTLPEIEWRGRSRRLGKTPVYFSFESSFASIQQDGFGIQADYFRGDLFPTVTMPISPVNWIDINPRVSYRYTYYTQQTPLPGSTLARAEPIARGLWNYGIDIVGPKAFRIFGRRPGATQYKHAIEPRITYGFRQAFDRGDDIILFDEVDPSPGRGKTASWALVQRLYQKRAQAVPPPRGGPETIVLPDGTTAESSEDDEAAEAPPEDDSSRPQEPVEVATLEFRQSRSFDNDKPLSVSATDSSPWSAVSISGRYNPHPTLSLDLRSDWDVLFDSFRGFTLSGGWRKSASQVRGSVVRRVGLGPAESATQVQLDTAFAFFRGKFRVGARGTYNANPVEGASRLPEQRWRVQYSTQCCTFFLERLTRDFTGIPDRRDVYFRVDLTGVGKILSHTF